MKRFRNILYFANGRGGRTPAFQRAWELATRNEARLSVLDVVELPSRLVAPILKRAQLGDVVDTVAAQRRLELQTTVEDAGVGPPVTIEVRTGTPFIEVIRTVLGGVHDLVITGEADPSRGDRPCLDSTTLHLVRKSPCPVWFVAGARKRGYARVLAAIDAAETDERDGLNARILTLAASQARLEEAELHVVHAWSNFGERALRYGFGQLPAGELRALEQETRERSREWLEGVVAEHVPPDQAVKTHLVKGVPGEVLPEVIRRRRVGLTVLGTVGRTGIPGFFIGNTAEAVLGRIRCSVLAVKPPGFVTPVGPE